MRRPLYATPARPWNFGLLQGTDIVTRQPEALIARYDLVDALSVDGHFRRDLTPATTPDPRLVDAMVRQLVRWVDYVPGVTGEDETEAVPYEDGWPIPQGVRQEAIYGSPWLDSRRDEHGRIDGKAVFKLPESAQAYAELVWARAGVIGNIDDELADGFRLTLDALGQIAMELRGQETTPSRAFLLLMARHYTHACAEARQLLGRPHPALQELGFRAPPIVAFELVGEIERTGMIVREVGRHQNAGARLRPLLEAANDPAFFAAATSGSPGIAWSQPLFDLLTADPAILTLCHFLAVSTPALASWYNAAAAKRGAFHMGFRPAAALGHGQVHADIVEAVAGMVDVRAALLSAFRVKPKTGAGSRQSASRNDNPFKFYGLTNWNDNLAAALVADLAPAMVRGPRPDGQKNQFDDDARVALASLVAQLGKAELPPPDPDVPEKEPSQNAVRDGAGLSRLYLPKRERPGAAGRGDATMWRDRYRDLDLWRFLQDPDPKALATLDLRKKDAARLQSALTALKRMVIAAIPQARSDLTARVAADLATGVSAISANPAFADGVLRLGLVNARLSRFLKRQANVASKAAGVKVRPPVPAPRTSLGGRWVEEVGAVTERWLKKAKQVK